jgi:hypothetical protein
MGKGLCLIILMHNELVVVGKVSRFKKKEWHIQKKN